MQTRIVLTLTGADRVGIVEQVTKVLLQVGGNVETSRMARLGGEFAMLMLVALPAEKAADLDTALEPLRAQGFRMSATATQGSSPAVPEGGHAYRVHVEGADHEGIIHDIAAGLAVAGITIESMETGTASAPVSGTPLFTMSALVLVPAGLDEAAWIAALNEAGDRANVDIEVALADS